MRERQFIEENKEKWREFESLVNSKSHDPERLGELFVQITDDLSYARTFYPNRSVRVYLNNLAQKIFHKLYRSRRRKRNRLVDLVINEIPSAVYHARRELILSLIIFSLAIGAGVLSGIKNPEFARTILGDQYVEMTEENISNDDPMAVYKGDNQFYLFARIAFNNLKIDFYTFVSGLFFGIWTILMLIYNGVMVGAFQYFFAERGLFSESFLTIWMHGALELSAAVIAGGAGLILGRGIVFPGTYSRLQSLMIAAREGLKILMIAVAMTTVAAIIESFLTRYTEIPDIIRLIFIALSFLFVLGYFVVLPWMKSRKQTIQPRTGERLLADLNQDIVLDEIKGVGKLFSEGFILYRGYFKRYLPLALLAAALYSIFNMLFSYELIRAGFRVSFNFASGPLAPLVWTFQNLGNIFSTGFASPVNFFNILLTGFCMAAVLLFVKSSLKERGLISGINSPTHLRVILIAALLALFMNLMFNINSWLSAGVLIMVPVLIVFISGRILDNADREQSLQALSGSGLRLFGVYLSFLLIGAILFTLFTYPAFSIVFMFGDVLFGFESIDMNKFYVALYLFFTSFALLLIIPPMISGLLLTWFTGKEVIHANGLRRRLDGISHDHAMKVLDA